ncbi:hypothetical protein BGW38_002858, partial [Lunasporangiospora selenospora]
SANIHRVPDQLEDADSSRLPATIAHDKIYGRDGGSDRQLVPYCILFTTRGNFVG